MPAGRAPVSLVAATTTAMGMPRPQLPGLAYASEDAMAALWRATGFVDVATCAIRVPVRFDDFEDYWASNTARGSPTAHFISGLSTERLDEMRARLRETLPIAADGHIAFESIANAVKGRKP